MSDTHGTNSSIHDVSYGADVSTDGQLRLCGDIRAKRTIELGLFGAVLIASHSLSTAPVLLLLIRPLTQLPLRAAPQMLQGLQLSFILAILLTLDSL